MRMPIPQSSKFSGQLMVLFWMTVYCETRKQILTLTCSRQDCLLSLLGKIAMKWTWIFHESIGN